MKRPASALTAGLFALFVATPAMAQAPIDVSAAYSPYVIANCPHLVGSEPCLALPGWTASVTVYGDNSVGLVGEVGGFGGTTESHGYPGNGRAHGYSLMIGPRFGPPPRHTFTPFGHVLFGVVAGNGSGRQTVTTGNCSIPIDPRACHVVPAAFVTSSAKDFAIHPGGGVEIAVSRRLALSFGGDFRVLRRSDRYESTGPSRQTINGPATPKSVSLARIETRGIRFTTGIVWRQRL